MKKQFNFILAIICTLIFGTSFVQASEPPSEPKPLIDAIMKATYHNVRELSRDFLSIDPYATITNPIDPSTALIQPNSVGIVGYVNNKTGEIIGFSDKYSDILFSDLPRPPQGTSPVMFHKNLETGEIKIGWVTKSLTPEAEKTIREDIAVYDALGRPKGFSPPRNNIAAPTSTPPGGIKGSAGHLEMSGEPNLPEVTAQEAASGSEGFFGRMIGNLKGFLKRGLGGKRPSSPPPPPKNLGPKGPGRIMGNPLMGLAVADAAWYHIGRDLNQDLTYLVKHTSLGIAPPPQDDSTPPRPDPSKDPYKAFLEQQQFLQEERSHPFVPHPASDPRAATPDDPPPPF